MAQRSSDDVFLSRRSVDGPRLCHPVQKLKAVWPERWFDEGRVRPETGRRPDRPRTETLRTAANALVFEAVCSDATCHCPASEYVGEDTSWPDDGVPVEAPGLNR